MENKQLPAGNGKVKMTFGIQKHHIERINKERARWNQPDKDIPGTPPDAILIEGFWEQLGQEFGWHPFTLALHYMKAERRIDNNTGYRSLWDYLHSNHDLKLLESEVGDLVHFVHKFHPKQHPRIGWVKCSERLPEQKREVIFRKKEVSRTAKPFYVNEYLFNLIVEGVILIEYYIGCPLSEIEWLDESAAAGISQDAHEKEVMMSAFDKVRQIFEGRSWIMEGRGGYPYNDDRYKEEVRYMYDEFDKVFKDTWGNIESKSIEYREWIIAEYLQKDHPSIHDILNRLGYQRAGTTAAGREDAVEFAEWLLEYGYEPSFEKKWVDYSKTGDNRVSSAQLYELFKQQK